MNVPEGVSSDKLAIRDAGLVMNMINTIARLDQSASDSSGVNNSVYLESLRSFLGFKTQEEILAIAQGIVDQEDNLTTALTDVVGENKEAEDII
jgi:hypothetical protein